MRRQFTRTPSLRTYGRWLALASAGIAAVPACSSATEPTGTSETALLGGFPPVPPINACQLAAIVGYPEVLTERSNNQRTSMNKRSGLNATLFAPGNGWGLLQSLAVDGPVFAQPLYATNLTMADGSAHDVLFVATGANKVYAFDANNYQPLWGGPRYLGRQGVGLAVNDARPPIPSIVSTPVVDPTNGVLHTTYLTFNSASGLNEFHVASLRLSDGASVQDHLITASHHQAGVGGIADDGSCSAAFELCADPDALVQRASLLLERGILYVAFAAGQENMYAGKGVGFGKNPQDRYRGQLLAYDARTLTFAGSFTTVTPGAAGARLGGGIWQGSVGPAADCGTGDVYVATGNAMSDGSISPNTFDADLSPERGSYANSVIRLHPTIAENPSGALVGLSVVSSFTPYRAYWMNLWDVDFGSSGPLLVPGTNQIVQGGKEGILYILDRDGMSSGPSPMNAGTYNAYPKAATSLCPEPVNADAPSLSGDPTSLATGLTAYVPNDPQGDNLTSATELKAGANYDIDAPPMDCWPAWPHVHGTPAFATFPGGSSYMYVWPEKDYLKAYLETSNAPLRFADPPATNESVAPSPSGMPGGMITVAVDSSSSGLPGVLFATVPTKSFAYAPVRGSLHAYNPIPDSSGHLQELWNDNGQAYGTAYNYSPFVPPTLGANNRVYVATTSGAVLVYGTGADNRARLSVTNGAIAAFQQDVANKQITAATIGADGAVHVFWEMNNDPWVNPQQEAVVTATGIAPPGGAILSIPEIDRVTFDTFFIDNAGAVNWLSVVDGQDWMNHGRITPTSFVSLQGKLSATLQGTHTVDVFVVGPDQAAYVLYKVSPTQIFAMNRISPTGMYALDASLAAGQPVAGELSLLSVSASGQLFESDIPQLDSAADTWGAWSVPRAISTNPAITFPPNAYFASSQALVAGVDNTGTLDALTYQGNAWRAQALSKPGGAVVGGSVAIGYRDEGTTPMVLAIGREGALDVYVQPGTTWTAPYQAHTQTFGVATPGAPLAFARQSSNPGAEVLDVLVSGSTDVFVSYLGGDAPVWARPQPVFH